MTRGAVDDGVQEADLVRLRAPIRRYLGRVVADEHDLDDLVQETLLRLWEVRGRVDRAGAAAYAITTARNLEASRRRAHDLQDRHAHRLHEPTSVDGPEQETLRREEQRAVAEALAGLEAADRTLLDEEYGDGAGTAVDRSGRRRSRLARARSRARVDYLLHLRRLDLPSPQCRPVLEALSSGDRRAQDRARVDDHLAWCRTCGGCEDALRSRERSLFGVVAIPFLILWALAREAPRSTAVAGVAVTATAVAAVLVVGGPSAPSRPAQPLAPLAAAPTAPQPAPQPALQPAPQPVPQPGRQPVPAQPTAPAPAAAPLELTAGSVPASLAGDTGRRVVVRDALVLSVPADEGFFVGPDDAHRVFVRLVQPGESSLDVRPGRHVSFVGTVAPVTPLALDGVDAEEGRGAAETVGGVVVAQDRDLVLR